MNSRSLIIQSSSRILSRRLNTLTKPQPRRALATTAAPLQLRHRTVTSNRRSSSNPSTVPSSTLFRRLHTSPRRTAMSAAETDAQAAQNAEEMQITPDSLSATLKEKIGATHCEIEDMSGGCGQAFQAIIVSSQFEKKNSLARHRLVNGALKQEIAAIHAWTPKCFTPEEWEKKKAS